MALISCPECKREISDKAPACPHCGYPMTPECTPLLGTHDPSPISARSATIPPPRPAVPGPPDPRPKSTATPPRPAATPSQSVVPRGRIILGSLLLLLLLGGFLVYRNHQATERRKIAETVRDVEVQRAREALQAFKTISSITTVGITYPNYLSKLGDLQVVVDRYLDTPNGSSLLRSLTRSTMTFYKAAQEVWKYKLAEQWGIADAFGNTPVAQSCPPVKKKYDETVSYQSLSLTETRGIGIAESTPDFWSCASQGTLTLEKAIIEFASAPAQMVPEK